MTLLRMKSRLAQTAAALAVVSALGHAPAAFAAQDVPFSISVDGEKVDSSAELAKAMTAEKAAIGGMDIQVKFDGLGVRPILNVSNFPLQVNFRTGEKVRFLGSYNYGAWIDHAEVRIISTASGAGAAPFAVIPVSAQGAAEWIMPDNAPADMAYVLRVYDHDGRFDETRPLPIKHSDSNLPLASGAKDAVAPGYGEDRTAFRNISVFGGAITVYGKNIPAGHEVRVMGEAVPVDNGNGFVVQRIMPSGKHKVDVSVAQDGKGLSFVREVDIPENEWFGIGLADLTVGNNLGSGIIEHTGVDEFPGTWTRGRAAMYLKGKIKGKYILTASADTGEGTLENMFTGLAGKDPRELLKRISPNDYYPVYGDDSAMIEDAPTNGKVYVRLDNGPSHVMWGNFKTDIAGTKFMVSDRTLYGASGVYRSDTITPDGAPRHSLDIYAAQPSTVPDVNVFRGTGGSTYYMRHQDITAGSDVVSIEVRNAITGWVISRLLLANGTDYRFDIVNGVLILNSPLPSNNTSGYENYLVVHYDFQPIATDTGAYAYGSRGETWVGDHVRVGVTGMREKEQSADQTIYGADVRVQSSPLTFVEGEVAHSEGPGFGSIYSIDGGISQQLQQGAGVIGVPANGWRVEGAASLDEVTKGAVVGHVAGRLEHYDPGFSSPEAQATAETVKWGVDGEAKLGKGGVTGKAIYSEADAYGQSMFRAGEGRIVVPASQNVDVEPYVKYAEQGGVAVSETENGSRGVGGVQFTYHWDADHAAYVFGQGTFVQTGSMLRDNRAGVGGRSKINDRLTAYGEVSEGTMGFDANVGLEYAPTAADRYNIGYHRDAFRATSPSMPYVLSGYDLGNIVLGARHKFNDQWSMFNENTFDFFGERRSLTETYGVEYTPSLNWKLDGALEAGRVIDNTINSITGLKDPDIYRDAGSLAVIYNDNAGLEGRAKGEARWDYSEDGSGEVMAYLLQLGAGAKMSKDWRALANLDVVLATASEDTKDSTYISGVVGAAYRPETSDRLNALVKYQYLYDNPGTGQVTVDGTTSSPAQISHIFSADGTYALNEKFSIGGKYAFRIGEIKDRTLGADWTESQAHLGIVRLDYHIVNAWDAMAEGRALWSPTTGTTDYGFVAAIYREVADNFKVGLGYNFGDFSDDISHINHNNHGVFLNLIGKF